ncbi:14747_t:CDS:2, partial [Funneliformis geosporum]
NGNFQTVQENQPDSNKLVYVQLDIIYFFKSNTASKPYSMRKRLVKRKVFLVIDKLQMALFDAEGRVSSNSSLEMTTILMLSLGLIIYSTPRTPAVEMVIVRTNNGDDYKV